MKVILSGGGTAGHIFPALSVAQQLKQNNVEILFVGALNKMEMQRVPAAGFEIVGLPIVGIQRSLSLKAILHNLQFPFKLLKSKRIAKKIIKEFKPDVVVGFGGYASAPIMSAAQKLGIPTVIQEQNSYAGLANRTLAKNAKTICVAYPNMERFFPSTPIVYTGNPLRVASEGQPQREEAAQFFNFNPQLSTILVTGGSLGTRTLNEMVYEFLKSSKSNSQLVKLEGLQLIWQRGKFYEEEFLQRVKDLDISSKINIIAVPFVDRMDMAYAVSDLVVCRAGASTVSELQLLGVPALFVPSPNVAEDHQTKNAMAVVEQNGASMVRDVEAVECGMQRALEITLDSALREDMSQNLKKMGKPMAAQHVAEIVMSYGK